MRIHRKALLFLVLAIVSPTYISAVHAATDRDWQPLASGVFTHPLESRYSNNVDPAQNMDDIEEDRDDVWAQTEIEIRSRKRHA